VGQANPIPTLVARGRPIAALIPRAGLPRAPVLTNFASMCTLILGLGVVAPGTMLLGANRDEDPARPSDPPLVLDPAIPIVGGRDRLAGGTWLAVRGREAAIAMLNRAALPPPGPLRSRGLLAIDVARDPDPALAFEHVVRESYAPFTLVVARPKGTWVLSWEAGRAAMVEPKAGWHVFTHAGMDDRSEPRTAALLESLADFRPATRAEGEAGIVQRLSQHEGPAVCLHDGRMVTVSSALVWLAPGETGYRHADGRPCVTPFKDYTSLLTGPGARESV
jgi:hypothetical protein